MLSIRRTLLLTSILLYANAAYGCTTHASELTNAYRWTTPVSVSTRIRLVGGSSVHEGRVEVFHKGEWGTVCDDAWNDTDASVVCRQLGYSDGGAALSNATFGQGSGPIWLDDVACTGSEESLQDCGNIGWGSHNCRHSEDAGARCFLRDPTTIRLVGGSSAQEGRVEVFHNGQWGTVCDDNWNDADAVVVCRQLGYIGDASAFSNAWFGPGFGLRIWLNEILCTGNEKTLQECRSNGWGSHDCHHTEDAGVRCLVNDFTTMETTTVDYSTTTTRPVISNPTTIRLVGGSSAQEGRVEVFHNGQWGTVCDDNWHNIDAAVVCHQLGYIGDASAFSYAAFGQGSGRIWLDDVFCTGNEKTLQECRSNGWGSHNCNHYEDAGVRCHVNAENSTTTTRPVISRWVALTTPSDDLPTTTPPVRSRCHCRSWCYRYNECCTYCQHWYTTQPAVLTTTTAPVKTTCYCRSLCYWYNECCFFCLSSYTTPSDSTHSTKVVFVDSAHNFTSPNFPGAYPNNLAARWHFSTFEGFQLLLKFHVLVTEACCDSVKVGNGNSTDRQLVFSWGGGPPESEVRFLSSGNTLWITFDTDSSVTETGFEASVEVVNINSSALDCDGFHCVSEGVCIPYSRVCYLTKCASAPVRTCLAVPTTTTTPASTNDLPTTTPPVRSRCHCRPWCYRYNECCSYCQHWYTTQPAVLTTTTALVRTRCHCRFSCYWYNECCSYCRSWYTTPSVSHNEYQELNCNFENGTCLYFQSTGDDFDWTRHQGSTPSSNTGPPGDHTTGIGYYMYIEATSKEAYSRARLISYIQLATDDQGLCLSFFYHMYGDAIGTLTVFLNDGYNEVPIFRRSQNQGNEWWRATAQLRSTEPWLITFQGTRGTGYEGDIAIDDISVFPGPCPTEDLSTTQPVSHDQYPELNCTFEYGTCGYYQRSEDNFDWTRHSGNTSSPATGPPGDHTTGTGYYMYIDASYGPDNSRARLVSSLQDATNDQGLCLSFFYHMYGDYINTLSVFLSTGGNEQLTGIFRRSHNQGYRWWRATAQFRSSSTWRIIFEGRKGNDFRGDIAIDDISIFPGPCPTEDLPTTQPVASYDEDGILWAYSSWNTEEPDPLDEINLHCEPTSFQVDLPMQILPHDMQPNDFFLSGDPFDPNCRGFRNGDDYFSLNSSLTGCGTTIKETETLISYLNLVAHTSNTSSVVERYIDDLPVQCDYDRSKQLQSHFVITDESSQRIKRAKGSFIYDFSMYTDMSFDERYYSYPVETTLDRYLYFRAELQPSPDNLRIHIRSCRATPSQNFDDAVVYEFIHDGCVINDANVRVLTPSSPVQADFEIQSFRFRPDLSNYTSQVWIHCEVVVCDINDPSSECLHDCERSRRRRSVAESSKEAKRLIQGPILFTDIEDLDQKSGSFLSMEERQEVIIFTVALTVVCLVMFLSLLVVGGALFKIMRRVKCMEYRSPQNERYSTL